MVSENKIIGYPIEKIGGWLSALEGNLLYNLAKTRKGGGVIVEIGSWLGKSTVCLAKGSQAGSKVSVYAVDPHIGSYEHTVLNGGKGTLEEFKNNILEAEVNGTVKTIVDISQNAAAMIQEPIAMVFIDGDHSYEAAKLDFELWFPKLMDEGIMAFHDSIGVWPGPKKVVREFLYRSKYFKNLGCVGSIAFAQKVKMNSLKDRTRNYFMLFLNYVSDFFLKMRPPKPLKRLGEKFVRAIQGAPLS